MLDLTIKISAVLEDMGKALSTTGQQVLIVPPFLELQKVNIKNPVLKHKWFSGGVKTQSRDNVPQKKNLQFTIKTHFSFQDYKACF